MCSSLWSHRLRKKKPSKRSNATAIQQQRKELEAPPHPITQFPTGAPAWHSTLSVTTSCLTETTFQAMSTDTSERKINGFTRKHRSPFIKTTGDVNHCAHWSQWINQTTSTGSRFESIFGVFLCFRFQNGKKMVYLPLLFVDELSNRVKDLVVSFQYPFLNNLFFYWTI